MTSAELENLVRAGQLKHAAPDRDEIAAFIRSGEARLVDAANETLSVASRFDLAYNAAHALSLAGLRLAGYRSENRQIVFQVLPNTLGMSTAVWRILAKCHGLRNRSEYEGTLNVDAQLMKDLLAAANAVRSAVRARMAP